MNEQRINITEVLDLPEPTTASIEEARQEIKVINSELRALSASIKPYEGWISRVYRRIETLIKMKHALQAYLTVGVKKIPKGEQGIKLPRNLTKEQALTFITELDFESLEALALALDKKSC